MNARNRAPKNRNENTSSPASLFGQIIGDAFEAAVIECVEEYLASEHPDYVLLEPEEGRSIVTLDMVGGLSRQMDNVLALKDSDDPIGLLETKWLKDGRHHNDKGAWILQLREVRKSHPTVRGASALLLGYWTEGVGIMLMNEGGINMVLIATDEQVYATLQRPLDRFLGADTFKLDDMASIRDKYPRPRDLLRLAISLERSGELDEIARSWLAAELPDSTGKMVSGVERIKAAIDVLLAPLPSHPEVKKLQISLQIDSGNVIYGEFADMEEAMEFIENYCCDPQAILSRITPKKRDSS